VSAWTDDEGDSVREMMMQKCADHMEMAVVAAEARSEGVLQGTYVFHGGADTLDGDGIGAEDFRRTGGIARARERAAG